MKKILIGLILLIIIILLGFFGFWFGKRSVNCKSCTTVDSNNNYLSGWNALRDRIINSGYYNNLNEKGDILSLAGVIEKINGNELILKLTVIDPLSDPDLDKRTIIFDEGTVFTKTVKKDEQSYISEMEEATKNKNELRPDSPNSMPSMFLSKSADASDLKVDKKILVTSEENIKNLKKINAKKIHIQE